MDKLKMETPDLTEQNIEKIGALFPNCITETMGEDGQLHRAVNFELLRQMLSSDIVKGDEAYEFTWVGKKASIVEANKPIRKTLRPCKEESKNWDTTENLYIEGDNLDVLKLLQESYLGKVKMIYIDPPYNTGHDFIYKDRFDMDKQEYNQQIGLFDEEENKNFVENSDSNPRFHSDWCSMMYSRLELARNLLHDDGVILINMDEHEITNLQKICSEIFGETNDLGTIVWDKRNPKGDAKGISYQHEYIAVYAKNRNILTEQRTIQRPKKNALAILKKAGILYGKIDSDYSLDDANNDFALWMKNKADFSGGEKAYNQIDEYGEVFRPVSMAWPNKKRAPEDYFVPLIHPITKKACPVPDRGWRNPSSTMRAMQEQGRILFGKDETTIPNSKYLLRENMYENIPSLLYYGGSNTDLLQQMKIPFETPKVVEICKEHIKSFVSDKDIVLDFFSGSATTAHAVMQLNAEDGGHRKFIMVQLPEPCDEKSEAFKAGYKNICEIGKERIRRAGDKIVDFYKEAGYQLRKGLEGEDFKQGNISGKRNVYDSPENIEELNKEIAANIDIGFRVLKVDETNMKDIYYSADEYKQDMLAGLESNIKEDRTDLDLLFGCLLDWGLPLSMPYTSETIDNCTVHTYNNGDLIACFNENVPESVIRDIASRKPLRVVFRDSSFSSSPEKINVEEIFKLITPSTTVKVI